MAKFNFKGLSLKTTGLKVLSVGGGAYAAVKMDAVLDKIPFEPLTRPVAKGFIKLGLGALLPVLTKQKVGSVVDNACNGVIAVGALQVAQSFDNSVKLSGIGADLPTLGDVYTDEEYTAGTDDVLGGDDDDMDVEEA